MLSFRLLLFSAFIFKQKDVAFGSYPSNYSFENKLHIQSPQPQVTHVHIIFMNHLDVGFDGLGSTRGFINNVLNKYFTEYFPRAIDLHKNLVDRKYVETFKYTTHPWLLDLYLNCPRKFVLSGILLKCPTAAEIQKVEDAIRNEVIVWHSGAMNIQYENNNPLTLEMGLDVGKRLEVRFNKTKNYRVLSQRDIPGLTRSIVPYIAHENFIGITNGINGGCPPADIGPGKIVRWQVAGSEVIYMHTIGGYPSPAGPDPAHPNGLSIDNCHLVNGFSEALCFAFRSDNQGPPANFQEILADYEILRYEFPNAKLFASTLEAYFELLVQHKNLIPVFTKEIGDTWMQGAATDPLKASRYKGLARVMEQCFQRGACSMQDQRIVNASRYIVKLGEHTFGLDTVRDSINWANDKFYKVKNDHVNFVEMAQSWMEQRQFLDLALDALKDHKVGSEITDEWNKLTPKVPNLSDYSELSEPASLQKCVGGVQFQFSKEGAIYNFVGPKGAVGTVQDGIGSVMYATYNQTDVDFFTSHYNWGGAKGWNTGFGKYNATVNAHPVSRKWDVRAVSFYKHQRDPCTFAVNIIVTDPDARRLYGAPLEYWNIYKISDKTEIDITHQWFDKHATRLMETLFIKFPFMKTSNHSVSFSKLRQPVSPYDVVLNGSQWQHFVDDLSVTLFDKSKNKVMDIYSYDTPLACPYTSGYGPTAWPVTLQPIPPFSLEGVAFSSFNNLWDVNFILWYPYLEGDEDYKARFKLKFY